MASCGDTKGEPRGQVRRGPLRWAAALMGPGHPRLSASSEAARRASCDALHLAGEGTGLGEVQSHCSKLTAHVGASSPTRRGSPPPHPPAVLPPLLPISPGAPRGGQAGRARFLWGQVPVSLFPWPCPASLLLKLRGLPGVPPSISPLLRNPHRAVGLWGIR